MTWTDIDGWLTQSEGNALAALAAGKLVLELGSYKGRSTVAMAQTATHVVSIDCHKGDDSTGSADTLAEFLANLEACGIRDKVVPIVGRIEAACFFLAVQLFDMTFIDDDHAASVSGSTEFAVRATRPGGIIAWHDWNFPAVREAARVHRLEPTSFVDELAWVTV